MNEFWKNAWEHPRTTIMGVLCFLTAFGSQAIPFVMQNQAMNPWVLALGLLFLLKGVLSADAAATMPALKLPETVSSVTASKNFPPPFVPLLAAAVCLTLLCGCAGSNKARDQGDVTEADDYEQSYKNECDRADSLAAANIINHTKKLDLELKIDLDKLATQATLNAPQWTAVAIAAETTRLQALHDSKIVAYKKAMDASLALRTQNEAVNLKAARAIRDAKHPPAKTVPLNQSAQIQANTGTQAPATLLEP